MTVLEDRLRRALRRYDPVHSPAPPGRLREPRPLAAHEGKLPAWLPEPYGPDPVVFGPPRRPKTD